MHIPVLFDEVMVALQPAAGKRFLDATLGGAGHTSGLLRASGPDGRVLSTDADAGAVARAAELLAEYGQRSVVRQCWLDQSPALAESLGFIPLDGALIDLGLSSTQLDDAERGFSFMREGPLDMRFDTSRGLTAAEWIDRADLEMLIQVLREYGEVTNARHVAEAIWAAKPFRTTGQLRTVAAAAVKQGRKSHIHPATQVFQALRTAVNDELRRLTDALPMLIKALAPGGRLAVIAFHSLEDRIVKNVFREAARSIEPVPGYGADQQDRPAVVRLVSKEPITASEAEIKVNPRARSAKLRVVEKLAV